MQAYPKRMRMKENVRSPEGWPGIRYLENGIVVSEELDSLERDNRYDLWRYYTKGRLTRELRDMNRDGLIDLEIQYSQKNGFIESIRRFELEARKPTMTLFPIPIKHLWIQRMDRDLDGTFDFEFTFHGSLNALSVLAIAPSMIGDARDFVPQTEWRRLAMDTNGDDLLDSWIYYRNGHPHTVGTDSDGDGLVDRHARVRKGEGAPSPSAQFSPPERESETSLAQDSTGSSPSPEEENENLSHTPLEAEEKTVE